ncbi:conserved hypothetical protein [Paraburkholderia tropica]|uniref:hypothetical protein n=1 Tax=Paraburkholderia tropica TaxID=92647 RepID=UPI001CAC2A5A|nr:hypothetical protein [Paraburkholderia tropica]CAG9207302.1 conserved hypothetical protein [Paraburkholderia tropica]
MTIANWKYDDFVRANNGKFSVLDFMHAVSATGILPQDFSVCMARLFSPRLNMFDNVIVVDEWFDESRYREYRSQGMSSGQAQAWVNMIEITDIFQEISFDKAKVVAELIAGLWSLIIKRDFPDSSTEASVISDVDLGEVFVTVGAFSASE